MTDAPAISLDLPALPAGLRWQLLGLHDLARVESLHRTAVAGLAPRVVKPETHTFLASILGGRGRAVGIETDAGELIAYGFLQHALLPEDDPRPHLGLAPSAPIAKLAGAAVARAYRGVGLQRRLIEARVALAEPHCTLFATASPDNAASWINLLAERFWIRRLEYRYGGHPRFLHVRTPGAAPAFTQERPRDVPTEDLATHEALLADGWCGVEAVAPPPAVRYRHREASA